METKLVDDTYQLDHLDGLLTSFVKRKSSTYNHDMVVAILPPFNDGQSVEKVKPYRLVYVGNDDEFVSLMTFLESLGMQCINKQSDSINNLDFVFIIPEECLDDLYPEKDPHYFEKLAELRALFNR
ncbi:hypothetical protein ACEWBT_14125 [Vibrio parahaemolyticus]|uniref:hypothetical protein n=1 Tax=Vibrio parahaemolyticus TaxID=670 RepID=UPI00112195BA|nr:hypothetical protein [Vibrio parahaemolyticus]EKQ5901671.1 hypothetical protein [Vibrio parahaemolyticus]ELA8135951.1 hypothetical protein [Vibrio parahaemolyticus]MCD1413383.1 hypothetical protein [Vibrio parahaemolyticus]MDF4475508.1 hypothetical protein [Vibrio parahaemolyticus]MDF4480100.1 hypothetical protein [Vibrio parahaemolyticus]